MKKLAILLFFIPACVFAAQGRIDINESLARAKAANPARAAAIGQAQNEWISWASNDCMARSEATSANLNDPHFATCFSEQMIRRANQLDQYACVLNKALCVQ